MSFLESLYDSQFTLSNTVNKSCKYPPPTQHQVFIFNLSRFSYVAMATVKTSASLKNANLLHCSSLIDNHVVPPLISWIFVFNFWFANHSHLVNEILQSSLNLIKFTFSSSLNFTAYLDLDNFDQYARVRVNLWIIADEICDIVSAYLLSFGHLTKITFWR